MKEDILVNTTAQELRVAVLHQGVLQELHLDREATRGLVGNVYVGVVARVLPGMQSAFVDIGLERAAFLHVADLWQSRAGAAPAPIEKHLFEGQALLVQVLKDPIGTKGARLSTQISIAGRLLVYLPQDPHVGVSQRIAGESERNRLRDRVQGLVAPDERGGYIIRTMAEEADDAAFIADMAYLRRRWTQILAASQEASANAGVSGTAAAAAAATAATAATAAAAAAATAAAAAAAAAATAEAATEAPRSRKADRKPRLLYAELSLAHRLLRDIAGPETQSIVVDDAATLEDMRSFCRTYMPALEGKLRRHEGVRPLVDLLG
ncbi:MAG: ribonuclease E/G, partial [Lautropia sp.]